MDKEENILRLNKYLAHCGLGTRRQTQDIVKAGEIKVNDHVETNPFYAIQSGDKITHKGKLIEIVEKKVYILINKPKNMPIVKPKDMIKPDVMELVKKHTDIKVSPLDQVADLTAGLMVLTNDNELIEKFGQDNHRVKSFYQVALDRAATEADLSLLKQLISDHDEKRQIKGIDFVQDLGVDDLGIELWNGRDKIVYDLMKTAKLIATKVDRTFYGGLTKKDLKRGWGRHLTEREVIFIKHF